LDDVSVLRRVFGRGDTMIYFWIGGGLLAVAAVVVVAIFVFFTDYSK
jgi:hypothetical protein